MRVFPIAFAILVAFPDQKGKLESMNLFCFNLFFVNGIRGCPYSWIVSIISSSKRLSQSPSVPNTTTSPWKTGTEATRASLNRSDVSWCPIWYGVPNILSCWGRDKLLLDPLQWVEQLKKQNHPRSRTEVLIYFYLIPSFVWPDVMKLDKKYCSQVP